MPQGGIHDLMVPWESDETIKLLNAIKMYGHSWEKIKKYYLQSRSVSSIRNRYQRINKYTKNPINKCLKCGQLKKGHICIKQLDKSIIDNFNDDFLLNNQYKDDVLDTLYSALSSKNEDKSIPEINQNNKPIIHINPIYTFISKNESQDDKSKIVYETRYTKYTVIKMKLSGFNPEFINNKLNENIEEIIKNSPVQELIDFANICKDYNI